jgi:hypothetical protein
LWMESSMVRALSVAPTYSQMSSSKVSLVSQKAAHYHRCDLAPRLEAKRERGYRRARDDGANSVVLVGAIAVFVELSMLSKIALPGS